MLVVKSSLNCLMYPEQSLIQKCINVSLLYKVVLLDCIALFYFCMKPVVHAIKQITSYQLQNRKVKHMKCIIKHIFGTLEQ